MPATASSSGSRIVGIDSGCSKLRLEVLDVTSTAVALSVFTPPLQTTAGYSNATPGTSNADSVPTSSAASLMFRRRAPIISIQLDGRPWPHVAHAGSLSQEPTAAGGRGAETTVIVYGLVPGREYEISLDVSSGEGQEGEHETEHFTLDVETGQEPESRPSSEPENAQDDDAPQTPTTQTATPAPAATHTSTQSSPPESATPDHPPPPYSAEPSSATAAQNAEPQLRALLKKLRASSKRTEGVLNASVNALKKSVEKGLKEDQRARTRIGGLEEAVRKADEAALTMRTSDREDCEEQIRQLEEEEAEARRELAARKEGNGPTQQTKAAAPAPPPPAAANEDEQPDEGGEAGEGIVELARELDGLNKMIDELESERKLTEDQTLKTLESDLTTIEADLVQMDREEAHHRRMYAGGNRSSDSLDRVDPLRAPPPLAPLSSTGGGAFNIRWRRNGSGQQQQQNAGLGPPPPPQAQDPRSFGRFFRRNVSDPPVQQQPPPPMEYSSPPVTADGRFNAQQYAQQYQQMWAPPNGMPPLSAAAAYGTNSRSSSLTRGRPRSGSLNSVHSGNMPYGGSNLGPGGGGGNGVGFYRTTSGEFHELSAQTSRHSANTPLSPLVPLPESIPIPQAKGAANGGKSDKGIKLLSSSSGSKDKEKDVAGSSGSGGTSWGRLGNWSQVVGKGKRPQTPKDKEKDKKADEVKEE